ncbi:RNA-metabolising metallo-beta-lactamase [Thermoactinomyces sp. DSM 45891]|uniref:MBL fold metallo-hydrolase n=1 Tax=Thermoactinomyces sp. DSM 45891 TaxID=1761907 RepID=UPI000911AC5F|nr:MBL fold metallo-hydrolase [Thermoactinomyces sp. DSM 45891]SFX75148.1 RNA-metabolising metallo-beta-lactamase [Thermoactinomyces sp. DSM 45891]
MNISILGGGNEVGASCLHIELNNTRILVDAGMRMHAEDALPMIGLIEEHGGIDAIFVTHAHADHIGALPLVHSLYPNAPIYTTAPTYDLMKIMLTDSFKILEARCRQSMTLPPYTEQHVQQLLESILVFPHGELRIGEITIKTHQAGHILGAVMLEITGGGECLLVTGDLSFRAGRTIPGAKVPFDLNPDVVVIESTYGNRSHIDRNMEEKRLADHVAEVIAGGGFALIPAFALGRAQEVLIILQDYMEKGLIPTFPIYTDGLVTAISKIYRDYPQYLKGPLAHRIKSNGDPFFAEGRCVPVRDLKQREMILQGKPACIVASSGMLIGGASVWYAERLINDPKNAIFITGYQDEEAPGRKLLALAEGENRSIELNGSTYPVQCRVDKYGLSGHADSLELTRFIEKTNPTHTLLVHGDDDARNQLSHQIDHRFNPTLVENGTTYTFEKRSSGKGVKGKRYRVDPELVSLQSKIDHILLVEEDPAKPPRAILCTRVHPKTKALSGYVIGKDRSIQVTPQQILETIAPWNLSMKSLEKKVTKVKKCSRPYLQGMAWQELKEGIYTIQSIYESLQIEDMKYKLAVAYALLSIPAESQFQHSGERAYRLSRQTLTSLEKLELPIPYIKQNHTQALERVRQELEEHPRFLKCGIDQMGTENAKVMIHFDFPDAVDEKERVEISQHLLEITGWEIIYSSSIRSGELANKLSALLEQALPSPPSIHLDQKRVVVSIDPPSNWSDIQEAFLRETGFSLSLKALKRAQVISQSNFFSPDGKKPLENNKAIEVAKEWAQKHGIKIYKTGIHQQGSNKTMELHFVSPQIAARYESELAELASEVGMEVTYSQNPKQNEILQRSKELIPWGVSKNPSIHVDRAVVTVKVESAPHQEEVKDLDSRLYQETGYRFEIKV